MVEFAYFRSRSFLGANAVAFVVSFAMLAMFFFMALYMQNILGYSPLEAGIRFLPSTVVIIFTAPVAGRLADRIGPRPLMTAGLVFAAVALWMQSRVTVDTTYPDLLASFSLMGLGMGLVMSPMSTAAMNAVSADKAGAASGILSMFRMVGGTFGVAAIGALFQSLARDRVGDAAQTAGLPPSVEHELVENLGSGRLEGVAPQLDSAAAERLADGMREAFVHALGGALTLSAAVAAAGAVIAFALVEPKRAQRPVDVRRQPEAVEPAGAQ
jgi:MFS family permease